MSDEMIRADRIAELLGWNDMNWFSGRLQLLDGLKHGRVSAEAANGKTVTAARGKSGYLERVETPRVDWAVPASLWRDNPQSLHPSSRRYAYELKQLKGVKEGDWIAVELTGLSFNLAELTKWFDIDPPKAVVGVEPTRSSNKAKLECLAWLREIYARDLPNNPKKPDAAVMAEERWPDLSGRSFNWAWGEARKDSRPWMGRAGAPPKK